MRDSTHKPLRASNLRKTANGMTVLKQRLVLPAKTLIHKVFSCWTVSILCCLPAVLPPAVLFETSCEAGLVDLQGWGKIVCGRILVSVDGIDIRGEAGIVCRENK